MAFDTDDPLVNQIIYFLKWLREVRMTIPTQHEQLLTRMRDHPESGTVGDRTLCGEVIREAKRRFVMGLPNTRQSVGKEGDHKPVNLDSPDEAVTKDFFTFAELAKRWGVSWGTVQNWLRAGHVPVLDRAPRGKRGKKVVALKDVLEFEKRNTKRIR